MRELRRKVLLPVFQLSELASEDDPRAIKRTIKQGVGPAATTYRYRYVWDDQAQRGFNYNLFPVVLGRDAVPWYLGTIYILSQLEAVARPHMTSFQSRADDLGAYKEWLDTHDRPDELLFDFPKIKLRRPTYRYRAHVQQQIYAGEIAPTTGKRRMGTVIAFYRWLQDNGYFTPEYPPWEEKQYQLFFKNTEGFSMVKSVASTDVSIRAPKSEDPFAGAIQDGGKLRPLTGREQDWVLEATHAKGNTECYLVQLFIIATGARIQTVGTLRLRHFTSPNPRFSKSLAGDGEVFKLNAGPGTGIDTKNDKNGVLQIPRPVFEVLQTYALSQRAEIRRSRFVEKHGERRDPYLFLTQQGSPYYSSRDDLLRFNPGLDRRYEKTGQPVRQFITEHVIPYVNENYDRRFHYRIHDLRASFGMNMTELLLALVQKKVITLHRARMIVKDLLWHESFGTTDLYLNYRSQMNAIYEAVNGYGEWLQERIALAMNGMGVANE